MKVLVHIKSTDHYDLDDVMEDIQEDKKILFGFVREALNNNGEENIEYETQSGDYYDLFVSVKFAKEIDKEIVEFLMNAADVDYVDYVILDSSELDITL